MFELIISTELFVVKVNSCGRNTRVTIGFNTLNVFLSNLESSFYYQKHALLQQLKEQFQI